MAERDKVIKSGQITLPRILFLAVVGGIIVSTVYAGGIFLSIGYWSLTLAICALLFVIAMDYGVKMDKVDLSGQQAQAAAPAEAAAAAAPSVKTAIGDARPKKRGSRPVKRRR
ncbi:MAG: hypothetical protein AABN34_25175 [Acidobacteriota bacterium]